MQIVSQSIDQKNTSPLARSVELVLTLAPDGHILPHAFLFPQPAAPALTLRAFLISAFQNFSVCIQFLLSAFVLVRGPSSVVQNFYGFNTLTF